MKNLCHKFSLKALYIGKIKTPFCILVFNTNIIILICKTEVKMKSPTQIAVNCLCFKYVATLTSMTQSVLQIHEDFERRMVIYSNLQSSRLVLNEFPIQ